MRHVVDAAEIDGGPWCSFRNPNNGKEIIVKGLSGAIARKTVTFDLERLMEGATKLSCSPSGQAIVEQM